MSRRSGALCLVTPLGGGLFAHRYRSGVAVHPTTLRGFSTWRMEQEALDTFCWEYMPTRGDVVLDIGAGIGEEALSFSRLVGPTGRVVSVEAQPETYRRLVLSAHLNHAANVEPVNCAVTKEHGPVRIEDDSDNSHVGVALSTTSGTKVEGETLDGLTQRLGVDSIALLKMNIEGAERLALQAASSTLRRTRHVAISCHDFLVPHGHDPMDVATFVDVRRILEDHDFDILTRPDDSRSWIRYYLYGRNRSL